MNKSKDLSKQLQEDNALLTKQMEALEKKFEEIDDCFNIAVRMIWKRNIAIISMGATILILVGVLVS